MDFFVIGGACQNIFYNEILKFTYATNEWTLIRIIDGVSGLVYASAVPSVNNSIVVFGGKTGVSNSTNTVFMFYPTSQQVSIPSTNLPSPRSQTSMISNGNRIFLYGGNSANNSAQNDIWQFVSQKYCFGNACVNCISTLGCGWCPSNSMGYECIAGNSTATYINGTCKASFSRSTSQCPEEFPTWAIALIVIGGVVLIGFIVFALMKYQNRKDYAKVPSG